MDEKYLQALLTLLCLGDYNAVESITAIENDYCPKSCACSICAGRPWRIITFKNVGPITIGWRKRVINIDWSATGWSIDKESITSDDVTYGRDGDYIHAWGYGKAVNYLSNIIYCLHYENCKVKQEAAGENVEGLRRLKRLPEAVKS